MVKFANVWRIEKGAVQTTDSDQLHMQRQNRQMSKKYV